MNQEYYVLDRDGEYQIIMILPGSNPLHGYGSWNLYSGPFMTWDDAEQSISQEEA